MDLMRLKAVIQSDFCLTGVFWPPTQAGTLKPRWTDGDEEWLLVLSGETDVAGPGGLVLCPTPGGRRVGLLNVICGEAAPAVEIDDGASCGAFALMSVIGKTTLEDTSVRSVEMSSRFFMLRIDVTICM